MHKAHKIKFRATEDIQKILIPTFLETLENYKKCKNGILGIILETEPHLDGARAHPERIIENVKIARSAIDGMFGAVFGLIDDLIKTDVRLQELEKNSDIDALLNPVEKEEEDESDESEIP